MIEHTNEASNKQLRCLVIMLSVSLIIHYRKQQTEEALIKPLP